MKQITAICAVAVLVFAPCQAVAKVERGLELSLSPQIQDVPLIEWDDHELLAEQTQPAANTPPLVTPPVVTPPAASTPPVVTPPVTPVPATPPATTMPEEPVDPALPPEENMSEDDFSLGDIPVVETLELTADKARKALDVYILVREKYKDAELENFENLQDFVDQTPQGKLFEADVKAVGFANVTEWNTTITTLSFAYDNLRDDQTSVINEQITELQNDTEIADDMRNRMIDALKSMIPSTNNKKIVEDLNIDPAFKEKLALLETEGE